MILRMAGFRQLIESVNDTLKSQPDLELHSGRSIDGIDAHRPNASSPASLRSGAPALPDNPKPGH
ncbi:hypothetical protein [Dactylosporangium sp. NPDC051484]|uniref:hypothetical protein n=1 Tax=Dactylosporangium sp. NPDC051484 TaxID=3154942 RepID=UPI00344D7815